ncbi:MAG: hypothetical protein PHF46_01445 [Candidatus Gracilibacteria bacterium]|nr:hypothetical protein [Candidatus Gracilibacteria bacterium]MDD3120056.1 hypothetical protein [Candidatus Gracilibacteria bacterium]MDD4530243.1 hypothetical protein [Candidatus Gracilibacteria bacterium]
MEKEFFWTFNTRTKKSKSWYIIAGIVILLLIIYGLVYKIYAMSFVFLILPLLYFKTESRIPPYFEVRINENGIVIGNMSYPIDSIKNFGIRKFRDKPFSLRILLNTKSFSLLDIPLSEKVNVAMLSDFLKEYTEEEAEQNIGFFEKMIVMLKI